ncbi:B3 domain-containing transcription factor ABI3-like isoform X2 [Macadamia integrifolia]|uniref:B3 domain-containing transcription factor ABI3-like isoform X2 n=1 Tax=Macadamia integrifolia TaxID=60698 RepID=UPI001C4FF335|nr:B3 domain-containing transcription factor ABI3-like isoform X2 [Macadamia integrifolia]
MEEDIQMHEATERDHLLHGLERLESVGDQDPNFIPIKVDVEEEDTDLWLDTDPAGDLLGVDGVDDSSIFYGDDFPPLPDFPCISSSSSSTHSHPPPAEPPVNDGACRSSSSSSSSSSLSSSSSSSSSSPASWTMFRSDLEGTIEEKSDYQMDTTVQQPPLLWSPDSMEIPPSFDPQTDVDCINVMQELGDMDLIWEEPNSIFPPEEEQKEQQKKEEGPQDDEGPSEDLGTVFLEWLKSNKESISAEDLRSIKLKRSTIECAAQRLGGGKEGMTQLLKLILQWVQNHHLHKRRMQSYNTQQCFQNPNPTTHVPDSHLCFSSSTPWIPHQQSFYVNPTANVGFPSLPPMLGYMGDPNFGYPMVDNAATWHHPSLPTTPHFGLYNSYRDSHLIPAPPPLQVFGSSSSCGNQYSSSPTQMMVQGNGESLASSATKEARKKRMARQRRLLSHHRSQHHLHHQRQNSSTAEQHARLATDANCTTSSHDNPGANWVFRPSTAVATAAGTTTADVAPPPPSSDWPTLQPHHQRQSTSERRQGWKVQDMNLRFLLQKVLKQSDVGNLGRIVLPKEAETHLPELESRDGISIPMEDIGTSRIWNMRYRFWPNNKSRMYLLENTGDFVRSNGLQEGDFIVIYSDVKCGKYLIRGVKVPQPGLKMESKRAGKLQRNLHASLLSPTGGDDRSSSSPINETVT